MARPRKQVVGEAGQAPNATGQAPIDPASALAGSNAGTVSSPGAGPEAVPDPESEGAGPRPRAKPGPKPGAKSAAKARSPINGSAIEGMLYTIHMMLSAMVKIPELALSEPEAKALGKAVADVARHYDVEANPVLLDWTALAMCAGGIYGPRIVAFRIRSSVEKREATAKKPPQDQTPSPQQQPDPMRFLDPTQPGFGGPIQ